MMFNPGYKVDLKFGLKKHCSGSSELLYSTNHKASAKTCHVDMS